MIQGRKRRLRFALVSGAVLLPLAVLACYGDIVSSVHFYSLDREENARPIDFGRVPQRIMQPIWNDEYQRAATVYGDEDDDTLSWIERNRLENEARYQFLRARHLEMRGQFESALRAYRAAIKSGYDKQPSNPKPLMDSFIRERQEVFQAVGNHNSADLQTFLKATYLLADGPDFRSEEAVRELKSLKPSGALKPFVEYNRADIDSNEPGPALAHRYLAVYRAYPKSPRAEAALIMAIRSLLGERDREKPSQDEVAKGKALLEEFFKTYPNSRFYHNALGWLGRCEWLSNNVAGAVNEYVRQTAPKFSARERWQGFASIAKVCQLTHRSDRQVVTLLRQRELHTSADLHIDTGKQLRDTFAKLTPDQAKTVQRTIRQDPSLLASYLAFRIEDTSLSPAQERNLLAFATSTLDRQPNASAALLGRVAQLNYNIGQYGSAKSLAKRTLETKATGDAHPRAQYVLAGAEARLGHPKQAIAEYEKLIGEHAPHYLTFSAKEALALLEEHHGNLENAIELYRQLDYSEDMAYLADAKLKPQQLAHYISTLSKGETRNVLIYTLGMRYLRLDRFAEARQAFSRLPKMTRSNWGLTVADRKELVGDYNTVGTEEAPEPRDPLLIVRKLERLTLLSREGTSSERAQALYDKAAYIYRERNLLFYSPGLWRGERAFVIDVFWSDTVNDENDEKALKRHFYEHECLAHTVRLCQEILDRYPKAPIVPKALYTEAVAAERLSNLNQWWRNQSTHLLDVAVHRLRTLAREHPKNPLAKPAAKYAKEFAKELSPGYR